MKLNKKTLKNLKNPKNPLGWFFLNPGFFQPWFKEEEELAEDDRRLAEGVLKRREKNAKAAGGVALPLGTSLQDVMELALRLV